MKFIKEFFIKKKFPKVIRAKWFAYGLMQRIEKKEQLPMYFDINGKYITYKVGDFVPAARMDEYLGYYEIVNICKPYGDHAMWDDGKKYNLKLKHIKYKPLSK